MACEYCIHCVCVCAPIYSMDLSILYYMMEIAADTVVVITKIKRKECGGVCGVWCVVCCVLYACTRICIYLALFNKHFSVEEYISLEYSPVRQ